MRIVRVLPPDSLRSFPSPRSAGSTLRFDMLRSKNYEGRVGMGDLAIPRLPPFCRFQRLFMVSSRSAQPHHAHPPLNIRLPECAVDPRNRSINQNPIDPIDAVRFHMRLRLKSHDERSNSDHE